MHYNLVYLNFKFNCFMFLFAESCNPVFMLCLSTEAVSLISKNKDSGTKQNWVWISVLSLVSCETLGDISPKSLQFSHLKNKDNKGAYLMGLLLKLNKLMCVRCWEKCLVHKKCSIILVVRGQYGMARKILVHSVATLGAYFMLQIVDIVDLCL